MIIPLKITLTKNLSVPLKSGNDFVYLTNDSNFRFIPCQTRSNKSLRTNISATRRFRVVEFPE